MMHGQKNIKLIQHVSPCMAISTYSQ